MEGSRHEKAALVLTSYVIGFTTAFILYAQISNNIEPVYINVPQPMEAAVIQAIEEVAPVVATVSSDGMVTYQDGKLTVENKAGDEILLSFHPELTDLRADTATMSQGFHYNTPVFSASPDENFVFFCEQQDMTRDTCLGFVYDVASETIFPITKNGAPVLISEASAKGTAWSAAGLTIGTGTSLNPAAPWELGG